MYLLNKIFLIITILISTSLMAIESGELRNLDKEIIYSIDRTGLGVMDPVSMSAGDTLKPYSNWTMPKSSTSDTSEVSDVTFFQYFNQLPDNITILKALNEIDLSAFQDKEIVVGYGTLEVKGDADCNNFQEVYKYACHGGELKEPINWNTNLYLIWLIF